MNIDPNTGLAKLPDGYFFRVSRRLGGGYYRWGIENYKLTLRKKRWYGSELVSDTYFWIEENPTLEGLEDWLMEASVKLANRLHIYWAADAAKDKATSLLGDYPPKRLT